jgi:hypothetical protein
VTDMDRAKSGSSHTADRLSKELVKSTGGLPHATYADLTGLLKRGYALERSRNDKVGLSVYRLTPASLTGA